MNSAVTLVDFDRMLNGHDHIYSVLTRLRPFGLRLLDARRHQHGGRQRRCESLTSEWFYSKQTINSAIKALTARGFATLGFAEAVARTRL